MAGGESGTDVAQDAKKNVDDGVGRADAALDPDCCWKMFVSGFILVQGEMEFRLAATPCSTQKEEQQWLLVSRGRSEARSKQLTGQRRKEKSQQAKENVGGAHDG